MPRCEKCRGILVRVRRSIMEKMMYSRIYKCKECGFRISRNHHFTLYFAPHTHCPHCGNERVRLRSKPDKIDKTLKTPMSLLQRILGGRLYHCLYCRIQYYDLRKLSSAAVATPNATNVAE